MSDIRFNRWLHQSGTGGVYQDSSGRVGIGSSVPTSALDVQSGTIKIGNNTLSSSGISSFTTGPVLIGSGTSTGTASQTLQVTGGAYVSGSVGIGTTIVSSGFNLEIQDVTNNYGIKVRNPANTQYIRIGASNPEISSGGNEFQIRTNDAQPITFRPNNSEALRITSGGNIGVGITNPSQKLEVVGGEIKAGRVDSSSEGGQVSFGRSTDNATGWYIDVYGSTSTPDLRFVDVSNGAVRKTIDGSGRVLMPYQPSFFAYRTGGDTTVADNTIIVFDGTAHNIGSQYSTSTGKFTAPVTGVYAFHAQIWAKNGTGYSRAMFAVNGSQVTQNGFHPGTVGNSNDHSFQMSMVRSLSANDTVEVRVNLGPLTFYAGGSQSHTYFTGHFIG